MLLLLFKSSGGALLQASAAITFSASVALPATAGLSGSASVVFSTDVAAPVTGGLLGASARVQFAVVSADLVEVEVFHPRYGANVNKTSGILIHAE